jgi:hypothetical protein
MGQDGGHWGREQHLFCCVILDFISLGIVYLVGGFNTPLKNINQLGLFIPNIWKNKTCSKPPTRRCNGTSCAELASSIILQNANHAIHAAVICSQSSGW